MASKSPVTKLDWYRTPIDKETMAELMKMSDRKGFFFAGGHLTLLAVTGALTVYVWANFSFLWVLPLIFLHNNILSMLVAGIHELTHERVFKTVYLNRFFQHILSFIHWWNHPLSSHSHKDHHRYTCNNPLDKELLLPQSFTVFSNIIKPFIFNFEGLFGTIKAQWHLIQGKPPAIFSGGKEWTAHLISRLDEEEKKDIKRFSWAILLGHLTIITVSLSTGYWIIPLITSLAPFTLVVSTTLISYTQHIGLMSGVQDFRLNCRTYYTNPFFQFLYWNMNFHIEHHMYASVPCYNLPKLHETIKHDLPHIPSSLIEVWSEIVFIVSRQKKDPSFEYRQPFPNESSDATEAPRQEIASKPAGSLDHNIEYTAEELADYKIWECTICAFVYDEAYGDPAEGLAPGTRWEDIPDDWSCPDCGVSKADFDMVERQRFATLPADTDKTQDEEDPVIVIGSGLAGYRWASEFRKLNKTQSIEIITRDGGENYPKPMLSNALLKSMSPEDLVKKKASDMEKELNATIRTQTSVSAIHSSSKTIDIQLEDGTHEKIRYSKLILALGADQIDIPIKGSGADEILQVNDLDDYRAFREKLNSDSEVIILGGGLIGCEFANDLALANHKVHVIDLAASPLSALIPAEAGAHLKTELEKTNINWHLETSITSVEKNGAGYICTLSNGQTLTGDLVVSAIGLRPRTALAKAAGLTVNRGIVVDEQLQTSDPSIFALGDCAEIEGKVQPFIQPITLGAPVLARNIQGEDSSIKFPNMPVKIKSTSCEVLCLPPEKDLDGTWTFETIDGGLRSLYKDNYGNVLGYALLGQAAKEKAPAVKPASELEQV